MTRTTLNTERDRKGVQKIKRIILILVFEIRREAAIVIYRRH